MQNPTKRQYPIWLRWLCYAFLFVGFGLTFFHDQLASASGVGVGILQILAFITLGIGIVLFLLVREPSNIDRAEAYRNVFDKNGPPVKPESENASPPEPRDD